MQQTENQAKRAKLSAILAALVLAALTFGTFFVLKGYGPESALRKFHQASVNQDFNEALSLSIGSNPNEVALLVRDVYQKAVRGAQFHIQGSTPMASGRGVVVTVAYAYPGIGTSFMLWVVERDPERNDWRVNAAKTVALILSRQ